MSAAHGAPTFGLLQLAVSPPKDMHKTDLHQPPSSQTRSGGMIPSSSSSSSTAADSLTIDIHTPSQRDVRSRTQFDSNNNDHGNRNDPNPATVVLPDGLHESDDGYICGIRRG